MTFRIVADLKRLVSRPWFRAPTLDSAERYRKAESWYKAFRPDSKRSYDLELEYAYKRYEETTAIFDSLDAKAEGMFRFCAISTGVLLTAAKAFQLPLGYLALAALCSFAAGIIFVLSSRSSAPKALPIQIDDLIGVGDCDVEHSEETSHSQACAQGRLVASLHLANNAILVTTEWKATQNDRATLMAITGIVFFVAWLIWEFA